MSKSPMNKLLTTIYFYDNIFKVFCIQLSANA